MRVGVGIARLELIDAQAGPVGDDRECVTRTHRPVGRDPPRPAVRPPRRLLMRSNAVGRARDYHDDRDDQRRERSGSEEPRYPAPSMAGCRKRYRRSDSPNGIRWCARKLWRIALRIASAVRSVSAIGGSDHARLRQAIDEQRGEALIPLAARSQPRCPRVAMRCGVPPDGGRWSRRAPRRRVASSARPQRPRRFRHRPSQSRRSGLQWHGRRQPGSGQVPR